MKDYRTISELVDNFNLLDFALFRISDRACGLSYEEQCELIDVLGAVSYKWAKRKRRSLVAKIKRRLEKELRGR